MKNRIAIPSAVSPISFHEQLFLAGLGDRWEYRPVRPLVHVGDDSPDLPFPHEIVYEPPSTHMRYERRGIAYDWWVLALVMGATCWWAIGRVFWACVGWLVWGR